MVIFLVASLTEVTFFQLKEEWSENWIWVSFFVGGRRLRNFFGRDSIASSDTAH